jgi:tRNA A-37 threonylcarbamoyl transferase component Bud32
MLADQLGPRFLDHPSRRRQHGVQQRLEVRLHFPGSVLAFESGHGVALASSRENRFTPRCYEGGARETEIENSSAHPFTRRVLVIAKHHEVLRGAGLDTMEGVKHFRGELIKNHKGRRDIQRVETAAGVFFLKRNWKPYRKDGLKSLLTRGRAWSQSRVEWENSLALQRAGIGVAEPIAFGEECGLFWEHFSFIITASAQGELTLEEFLRTARESSARRTVLAGLAATIRSMHDAGLSSPDLFTRHIFVEPAPLPKFCLIDMARLDRGSRTSLKARARDLAALNVTAPLRFVSARERLRFLGAYGGDRKLRGAVEKRSQYLLRRRKFAAFHEAGTKDERAQPGR